jgi:hypothetical protein
MLQRLLVTWTIVNLTAAKFKPLIFSACPRLVLYREHVHSHAFVWLLLVACTILLYNRIHTEGWKLCANRRWTTSSNRLQNKPSTQTTQETQSLYCFRGMFTAPLHSNYRGADHIENAVLLVSRACMLWALSGNDSCLRRHCLATVL